MKVWMTLQKYTYNPHPKIDDSSTRTDKRARLWKITTDKVLDMNVDNFGSIVVLTMLGTVVGVLVGLIIIVALSGDDYNGY